MKDLLWTDQIAKIFKKARKEKEHGPSKKKKKKAKSLRTRLEEESIKIKKECEQYKQNKDRKKEIRDRKKAMKLKKESEKRKKSVLTEQDIRIRKSLSKEDKKNIYNRYVKYKTRCRKLNRVFELSLYEFMYFMREGRCTYCGTSENITIDRIDSSKGYTIDNVDPCCLWCNQMKNKYSREAFIKKIEQIYNHCCIK